MDAIKEADFFGEDPGVTFNAQNQRHATIAGGVWSILLRLAVSFYAFCLLWRLVSKDYDLNVA